MIMKRLFSLLAALVLCGAAFAQSGFVTPDFHQIKKEVQDRKSDRYYDKLEKRFAAADTTLTIADLQAFYFGRAFQKGFNPYEDFAQFATIRKIFDQEAMPTKGDLSLAVALADEVIRLCPSEPFAYFYKFGALSMLAEAYGGDTVEMQKAQLQFQMLFYTIASTGNGISPDTAMYVMSVNHEYLILNMYGFVPKNQSLQTLGTSAYDVFDVEENDYGVSSLFFNVDFMMSFWGSMMDEEEVELPEPDVPVRTHGPQIAIEPGSRVELELVKAKRKNSKFRVAMVTYLPEDTLSSMADTANLSMDVPEGRIVLYLFNVRDAEDSGKVRTCLMYSSNCKADMLYLDTKAHIAGASIMDFQPEENLGMAKGVWKTMMWEYGVDVLVLVNNIRTKK